MKKLLRIWNINMKRLKILSRRIQYKIYSKTPIIHSYLVAIKNTQFENHQEILHVWFKAYDAQTVLHQYFHFEYIQLLEVD